MDAGGGVVVATDPIHRARLTPAAGAERWSPLNPAAAFAGRGESPAPAARATRVQFRDACAARRVAMADAPSAPRESQVRPSAPLTAEAAELNWRRRRSGRRTLVGLESEPIGMHPGLEPRTRRATSSPA